MTHAAIKAATEPQGWRGTVIGLLALVVVGASMVVAGRWVRERSSSSFRTRATRR